MPKISVIVPVYNSERYLHKCIDSILTQTFKEFELLLIDDGSKDNSGTICDEYAAKDSRVCVFHKENGGVSSARNLGLDNATGEWITFVDADDWLDNKYFDYLLNLTKESNELIISYPIYVYKDGNIKTPQYPCNNITQKNFEDILIQNDLHLYTSPWGKLYSHDIIRRHKLRFCEQMHIGEDLLFLYSFILYAEDLHISSYTGYHYRFESENSLTKRVYSIESEKVGFENIKHILNLVKEKKQIKSQSSINKINQIIGQYTRRVINSIYHDESITKRERLELMSNIDFTPFLQNLKTDSYKEKILAFLLKKNHIKTYDFVRNLTRHIKNWLNQQHTSFILPI